MLAFLFSCIDSMRSAHNGQKVIFLIPCIPAKMGKAGNLFVKNQQKHEKRTFPPCPREEKVIKLDILRCSMENVRVLPETM